MSIITAADILRPCIADGKRALFHRWAELSTVTGHPRIVEFGHSAGVNKTTVAIVEYVNGDVAEVQPDKIRFLDHPHKFFDFTEREAQE